MSAVDIPLPTAVPRWGAAPRAATVGRPGAGGLLASVRAHQARWLAFDTGAWPAHLAALRPRLVRQGWVVPLRAEALGCAAALAQQTLGLSPFDTQLLAASALLDGHLAEMATGEGKTLVVALAAAIAALAGVPVHAMTANDYLARRDACDQQAFYRALGLGVGVVCADSTADERRAAYRCDITFCTAREVAFDWLRDRLDPQLPKGDLQRLAARLEGQAACEPLLPRRAMAILDEADSLLIDDAAMPLVISEPVDDAQLRAMCLQALAVARGLTATLDFDIDATTRCIVWSRDGAQRVVALAEPFEGAWLNARHRNDMVTAALEAEHLLLRDRDYFVRDGAVHLVDATTGRAAVGRVWTRGLQTLVELKEGCRLSAPTVTRARITFQRFFGGYERLCGLSGSLRECRAELKDLYALRVVAIAPRVASRRVRGRDRLYIDAASRRLAVALRCAELQAAGRPVLVGTDSIAESQALSAALDAHGIAHQVLNARHDAAESAVVARAGEAGAVTVATRMAGRGTDIALGAGVAARGGLHVMNCQDNPSARLDRQLVGRCARQGDPGSAETWRTAAPAHLGAGPLHTAIRRAADARGEVRVPALLLGFWAARRQRLEERRALRYRRRLMEQDDRWT